jgi:hypothetical protein
MRRLIQVLLTPMLMVAPLGSRAGDLVVWWTPVVTFTVDLCRRVLSVNTACPHSLEEASEHSKI